MAGVQFLQLLITAAHLRKNYPIKAARKIGGQQIGELQVGAGAGEIGEDRQPGGKVGGSFNPPSGVGKRVESELNRA